MRPIARAIPLEERFLGKGVITRPPAVPTKLPTPPPTRPKLYCVYCGAENPHYAIFCPKCGNKMAKP